MPEAEELVPEAELLPVFSVDEDGSPLRFPELPGSISKQHRFNKKSKY